MNNIYVSSSCLKGNVISDIIEELGENQIYNIELSGGTDFYRDIEKDLVRLKEKYGLNYVVHAYFPPPQNHFAVNLASLNPEIHKRTMDHYKRCIELMGRIGSKFLSVHAGFLIEVEAEELGNSLKCNKIYDKNLAIDMFCNSFKEIEIMAHKKGISVYIENNVIDMNNYNNFNQENLLMMTDFSGFIELKKHLKFHLLLDLGHLKVSCHTLGLDFAEECKKFNQYIEWIHISDNNAEEDSHSSVKKGGDISKYLCNKYIRDIPKTIEVKGTIKEIKNNLQIIEASCQCNKTGGDL